MDNTLSKILKFTSLIQKLQKVERQVLVKDESRQENDLEHSCHLAMLAWYMVNSRRLRLNLDLVIKYALIHDLVESYAGDTPFYDITRKPAQKRRERKAILKLQKEFPEFKDLHILIKQYEERKDKESKFVYALDKIAPILNIYLDKGRTWEKDGITLEMLITHKTKPVAVSPEIKKYFDKLIKILKRNKKLFRP